MAEARARLDAAVDALHASGDTMRIPLGYLARAALFRCTGDHALAAKDLVDAADIADRSGLKLFQADIALERARLTLARAEPDAATAATRLADAAAAIITEVGYNRRLPDLALLCARIAVHAGTPAAAGPHLALAKTWIDDGWRCHAREHDELTALIDAPPPAYNSAIPPQMQVTPDQLEGARFLETYRNRHLFQLADGRVYLDGLIAVSSLAHARATLDHLAQHHPGV